MKTTGRLLASIFGVIVASPAWAAGFGNGGLPFGGSSPFSSFSNPLGFGASPFGLSPLSMASPWSGGGFPMMGSGFPMMGGSRFPMMGSGMSPYSAFSPFSPLSPMGGGMMSPWSSGLMSRGLGSPYGGGLPFAGTSAYPLGGMASPYSMYGASPYGYGLPPLTGNPYLPYPAVPAPAMLPFAPLPY